MARKKKTTEQAYKTLQEIKEGLSVSDAIKDHEMPTLFNYDTGKTTGFAVILTLSTKYDYTNTVLEDWRKRLEAEDYQISVRRNQLKVRFDVRF